MKRFLQIAGPLYVVFALVTAHFAMAPLEASFADSTDQRCEMVTPPSAVRNSERLDFSYSTAPTDTKPEYTIEVWSADWCIPCRVWKKRELPTLLKAGYQVTVRDSDKERPPKNVKLKQVPTICLYYKGELLDQEVYWKAKDLLKFLENRRSLKK